MELEIALRAAGIALLALTALVLLASAPRAAVARWFAPFALGVIGFLAVNTAHDAAELPATLWPFASFLSRMAALFLWIFCLVLFDGRLRAPRVALGVGIAWTAFVVIDKGYVVTPPHWLELSDLQVVLATALVVHAGWRALREMRDDLVERRRRARPVFALGLLAFLALDLGADVLQGYGWRPPSFLLLQNGLVVALAASLSFWLLRAEPALMAAALVARVFPAATADPDDALVAKIERVMRDERPWLRPELTIAQFSSLLAEPEPAVRRAINHRLGHGHFRSFLNGYRVEEARRRLRDPAHAGDKILAIALDAGFASLASFNRVFRQTTGSSPTDYRRAKPPQAIPPNRTPQHPS